MAMRIVVYGAQGDGTAFSAMSQIRSLVNSMSVDVSVDIVTDPHMMKMNGVEQTPAVFIDGVMVSVGYAPSRMQMRRAIQQRIDATQGRRTGMS